MTAMEDVPAGRAAALGWLRVAAVLGTLCSCHGTATSPAAHRAPGREVLAITHVTLIDPSRASVPEADMTILIEGDRITAVGPSASTAIPAGAAVHDASGRFAIPGLWDAHVHVSQIRVESIPLLLANGVTSVRDMGSDLADVRRWRDIRSSGGLAPRVFSPGPKLAGEGEPGPDSWIVSSPDEARRAVDRLKALRVDFVKVHHKLSRSVYDAIVDRSRKHGLFFAGHATDEVPNLVAVAAGQRTIEHGRGLIPCSPRARARISSDPALTPLAAFCAPQSASEQILPAMARAGVWFTPTLVSWRGRTLDRDAVAALDGVRHVPPALEERWRGNEPVDAFEAELLAEFGPLTARAARMGVRLLTGGDAGDPNVVPGFALQDELRLFVEAGVPPLQALRAATIEPARALGVAHAMGSIAPGKAADVVLLAASPLADIRNTRRIVAVVLNGRWLTAEQLRALIPAAPGA